MPTDVGALTPSHPLLQLLQQQQQQDQQLPSAFPPYALSKIRSAANALPTERKPAGGHGGRRTTKRSEELISVEEANRNQVLLLQQSYTDFRWGRRRPSWATCPACWRPAGGMLDDDEGNINLGHHYLSDDMWAHQGRAGGPPSTILSLWRN